MTIRSLRSPTMLAALVLVSGLAACSQAPDTRLHPDPPSVHYSAEHHPFRNARLFHDPDTAAARWQATHGAGWLSPITSRPQARWLNGPLDLPAVSTTVRQARAQHARPVFVVYDIPNRGCDNFREGAPDATAYGSFVDGLIRRLAHTPAVIIMEPDAIAADCFTSERAAQLSSATARLTAAGNFVYLDAGNAHWRSTGDMAARLLQSGIAKAEGFAINVANRQTTAVSYAWGRELSDLVGGREFVIDTSRNGSGPPPDDPKRDNEWCNPHRQSLGASPHPVADQPKLAALLWIKDPGESDGECGGEHTYMFTPTQARNLIINTGWLPAAQRRAAKAARPAPVAGPG